MSPQALPKTNELLEEINRLFLNPEWIDDIKIAQLKRQAEHLPEPISRYLVQGALASLQFEVDSVHSHFQKALKVSGNSYEVIYNYALALDKMSFLFEASDLLLQYYQRWPDDLNFLRTTIRHCAITGTVFQAETILKQHWCRLTDESHPFEPLIHSWADFYRQYELTEAEVKPYLETALSLLRQVLSQQRQRYQLELDYFDEDGEPFLSYTVYLDLSVDDLLALEDQHNDLLLAGHFSSELLHGMIITFEPYPLETDKDG